MTSASLSERVAVCTLAVALASGIIYATGWLYALRFFEPFGVGLAALDLPKESVVMYGTWVLAEWWWLPLVALAGVLAWRGVPAGLKARTAMILGSFARPVGFAVLAGAFVAGFLGLRLMAETAADRHRADERSTGFASRPAIQVWFEAGKGPDLLRDALGQGCYRLLFRSKDALLLVRPLRDDPGAALSTLLLPSAGVNGVRLLPYQPACP